VKIAGSLAYLTMSVKKISTVFGHQQKRDDHRRKAAVVASRSPQATSDLFRPPSGLGSLRFAVLSHAEAN
jgi:hypothetical protein